MAPPRSSQIEEAVDMNAEFERLLQGFHEADAQLLALIINHISQTERSKGEAAALALIEAATELLGADWRNAHQRGLDAVN